MDAANPLLTAAEDQYRKAGATLDSARRDRDGIDGKIQEIDQRIARREREFDRWNLQLSAIKSNVDIKGETPELARANLHAQIAILVSARERAEANLQESAKQSADIARLSDVDVQVDTLTKDLNLLRRDRGTLEQKLQTALAVHAELETACRDLAPIEQLRSAFVEIDAQMASASRAREEATAMQSNQGSAVSVAEDSLLRIESELTEASREVARIKDQWTSAGLPGEPSRATISVATTQHELALGKFQNYQATIRDTENDLNRLRIAEDGHRAQEEIDRLRQDQPEVVFTNNLREAAEKASKEAGRSQDVLMALDTLSTTLSTQISDIHERVIRGVPTWQALLKRIVRDQRFSNATLEFFSRYNKEHAGMKVPLGSNQVAVTSIASEAQLTDVQLSFLLSLALGQTWSQWKGLLLDDPTQHHDLVHASAVFDVLRDFVIEHDFQLILATHDALQARYLMRKMENDGIDVRLWTLIPAEGGVKAIPSH
jgi:DNA repair protein SbcC/Rad50